MEPNLSGLALVAGSDIEFDHSGKNRRLVLHHAPAPLHLLGTATRTQLVRNEQKTLDIDFSGLLLLDLHVVRGSSITTLLRLSRCLWDHLKFTWKNNLEREAHTESTHGTSL